MRGKRRKAKGKSWVRFAPAREGVLRWAGGKTRCVLEVAFCRILSHRLGGGGGGNVGSFRAGARGAVQVGALWHGLARDRVRTLTPALSRER